MSVTRKKIVGNATTTYTKAEVNALIANLKDILIPDWTKTFILLSTRNIRYKSPIYNGFLPAQATRIAWGDGCTSSDSTYYHYDLNGTRVCSVKIATISDNVCNGGGTGNITTRQIYIKVPCLVDCIDGDYYLYAQRGIYDSSAYAKQFITGRGNDCGHARIYTKAGDLVYVANNALYLSVTPLI